MAAHAHRRLSTEDESEIPQEARLALLVIEKAIRDAYVANTRTSKTPSSSLVTPIERMEARCFCEAQDGEWAEARRTWLGLALIDPDVFDRRIQRIKAQAVPAMAAE